MRVSLRSHFDVSRDELWAWHVRPRAFERLMAPFDPVEVIEHHGPVLGARTTVRVPLGPGSVALTVEHTEVDPGRSFRDEQRDGPFARWSHQHRFLDDGTGSALEDELEIEPPLGALGRGLAAGAIAGRMERALRYRHALLELDLARHAAFASRPRLKVALTGASGLLGTTLTDFLSTGGHEVRPVKRRPGGGLEVTALDGADAVVHLAGAGVADQRWTPARKQELLSSRVDFTRTLVRELSRLRTPPRVLVSASGVGLYGDRGDERLGEDSAPGPSGDDGASFLTRICQGWEAEALEAQGFTRVALARFGAVLTAKGGALAKLVPAVSAGVGGPVASGKQWMSSICLEDAVGALYQLLMRDELKGPFNLVSPEPQTNHDFMRVLGHVLHRPTVLPAPAFALRVVFGELVDAALLPSQRAEPQALARAGYAFAHPSLEACLRFTLGRAQ